MVYPSGKVKHTLLIHPGHVVNYGLELPYFPGLKEHQHGTGHDPDDVTYHIMPIGHTVLRVP